MADYAFYIDGVEKYVLLDTVRVNLVSNGLDTCTFQVRSEDGSYVPAIDDSFLIEEDGTALFRGLITSANLEGHGGPNLDSVVTSCAAVSVSIYASFRYVTATLAAGTLKSQLTTLVDDYLDDYGIALHASQVNGPAMPEIVCTRQRLDEVLNRLTVNSEGYLWKIDADLKLRMQLPGSVAAPYDILDTGDAHQVGDLTIEPTRDDTYANRLILLITGGGPATSTETFGPSDYTTSGGFRYFTAKYPASTNINDMWPNVLYFDGVVQGPIGRVVSPGEVWDIPSLAWDWDMTVSPARLKYTIASGAGFPTTESITITYAIAYPFELIVEDVAAQSPIGIRERIIEIDQGMTLDEAQAYGESLLARNLSLSKARFDSHDLGWRPNQSLTINVAKRDVNATYTITDVVMAIERGSQDFRHQITAIEGAGSQANWRDTPKAWLGGGKTSGGVATTGAAGPGVAPPVQSVQFNREGQFGGDESFVFHEAENSVVCGHAGSITAAAFESCQVFGYDNHITDP